MAFQPLRKPAGEDHPTNAYALPSFFLPRGANRKPATQLRPVFHCRAAGYLLWLTDANTGGLLRSTRGIKGGCRAGKRKSGRHWRREVEMKSAGNKLLGVC